MLYRTVVTSSLLLTVAIVGAVALLAASCSLHRPAPLGGYAVPLPEPRAAADDAETFAVTRVGGDAQAAAEFSDGEFRSGTCRIPTPLPAGYPEPTPPGAIEVKRYPPVRRAGIGGTMLPDWGMNFAFFPLFNHIKRRDIAMTSPVEMNYDGLGNPGATRPTGWTMSFLYRTPELGPDGMDPQDTRILVEDLPPVTVVAIGMRGPYKLDRVRTGIKALRDWLSGQAEWEEAGDPRALFYNGPEVRSRDKWSEVQIPVRRR